MSERDSGTKTPRGFKRAVAKMALLKFFPPGPDERAELMAELGRVCQSDEEVMWLAQRTLDLYQEWPGLKALWQIWFSKYPPTNARERQLDYDCGRSETFPNGVPSETGSSREDFVEVLPPADSEAAAILQEAVSGVKSLPAGKPVVSAKAAERELDISAAAVNELKG